MSSDSDIDFYDATDESTTWSCYKDECNTTAFHTSYKSTTDDLLDEEMHLLDLRKKAEEQWKKEDMELEERLVDFRLQREDAKKELGQQLSDQERRRLKLEDMRHLLSSTNSLPFHSSNDSSSLEKDSHGCGGLLCLAPNQSKLPSNTQNIVLGLKSHTIERMENYSVCSHVKQHAKKRSGSWGDLPNDNSALLDKASLERNDWVSSTNGHNMEQAAPTQAAPLHVPFLNHRHDDRAGELLVLAKAPPPLPYMAKNLHQFMPEKGQDKSLTLLIGHCHVAPVDLVATSLVDDILKLTDVVPAVCGDEPDVVKSTKNKTLPCTVEAVISRSPVAPPRTKKQPAQTPSTSPLSGATKLLLPLPSPMLPRSNKGMESLLLGTQESHINTEDADTAVALTPTVGTSDGERKLALADDESDEVGSDQAIEVSSDASVKAFVPAHTVESATKYACHFPEKVSPQQATLKESVTVEMPLSSVSGEHVSQCVNPLSLHLMQRTMQYSSDSNLYSADLSDESDTKSENLSAASICSNQQWRGNKIKKILGKTVNKLKSRADHVMHPKEVPVEEEVSVDGMTFKFKSSNKNKGPYDFSQPNLLQELNGQHMGAIWTMKFSPCGKLLSTGGQDGIMRIWVLKSCHKYFEDIRRKYGDARILPTQSGKDIGSLSTDPSTFSSSPVDPLKELEHDDEESILAPFMPTPFCTYKGHSSDLLDITWSNNYFLLSSSMDKTVRLWHISRRECLCTFQHVDFVTAIVFHPKDDRYFLSGSLDGKIRLWNIPDKKVTMWNELPAPSNLITTASFCHHGRLAVVGTYDGRCVFYTTDLLTLVAVVLAGGHMYPVCLSCESDGRLACQQQLKYYTVLNVRSTRGKNSHGRKVTGIESMPGEEKILVTSNDSRVRLYTLKDLTLTCKYKGFTNNSSQIRASFSPTGKYIVSGSEDHFLFIWKTNHEFVKFASARRDRNDHWEAIKVHNAVVTCAVFAPNPSFIFRMAMVENCPTADYLSDEIEELEIIVSADFTGLIKVIASRPNS